MPLSIDLPEPPTESTLVDARRLLQVNRDAIAQLDDKIQTAQRQLEQVIADSKKAIEQMQQDKTQLEADLFLTKAYLSPIRRLPHELLRHIFALNFEDYPCCAWVLSAVCTLWRKLVLSMPRLWSKIRLVTTQSTSADTIRLWLERSGSRVPLDIEIFLRVHTNPQAASSRLPRAVSPVPWQALPWAPHPQAYLHGHIPVFPPQAPAPMLPPIMTPPTPNPYASSPLTPPPSSPAKHGRVAAHWGHIAIFYLVEQMHRWERFVFRFDKHFTSLGALKSITGDAPLLREFEVSCAEPAFYNEWNWLPCTSSNAQLVLPKLESINLQCMPFKWSSPMFHTNLRSLTIRSLPTSHLPLDRIMHIVSSNPNLESLTLNFAAVLPPVLPLSNTTLPELREFNLGGHYCLAQLIDSLILPVLDSLTLDVEVRDPIEDTISNLITRSSNPPLKHFSLAYSSSNSLFYAAGAIIGWTFLNDMNHLHHLQIGGAAFEPLLLALCPPDEDQQHWICPNLVSLGMKGCHAHGDGVSKLVQMVEGRNPDIIGGAAPSNVTHGPVTPIKLKKLELYDCVSLGQDVISWLKARIDKVICTEPAYERYVVVTFLAPTITIG
ncbi:hypothetical protein JAAARDRAFT_125747 [Jaapia argillacea MUCL 33604]|uniref:Uncharacterized protein n=1 Tax=Jaapia argillacea MUCL 33604 TaxID=933084 RepID=A0A067Q005_9AGAM|nr:hypothetical protein JAAARDRAFT_125747 [Jaapia argillacea MUCL 33604]